MAARPNIPELTAEGCKFTRNLVTDIKQKLRTNYRIDSKIRMPLVLLTNSHNYINHLNLLFIMFFHVEKSVYSMHKFTNKPNGFGIKSLIFKGRQ